MPRDKNGKELKVGDEVAVKWTVEHLGPDSVLLRAIDGEERDKPTLACKSCCVELIGAALRPTAA